MECTTILNLDLIYYYFSLFHFLNIILFNIFQKGIFNVVIFICYFFSKYIVLGY